MFACQHPGIASQESAPLEYVLCRGRALGSRPLQPSPRAMASRKSRYYDEDDLDDGYDDEWYDEEEQEAPAPPPPPAPPPKVRRAWAGGAGRARVCACAGTRSSAVASHQHLCALRVQASGPKPAAPKQPAVPAGASPLAHALREPHRGGAYREGRGGAHPLKHVRRVTSWHSTNRPINRPRLHHAHPPADPRPAPPPPHPSADRSCATRGGSAAQAAALPACA